MFFVIIFLSLATMGFYLFPDWSWAAILGASFGGVAALRLLLLFADRSNKASTKESGQ